MNFEELKQVWQCQKFDVPAKLPPDDQTKLMRTKLKALERANAWVDAMIIAASLMLIFFFARTFLTTPLLVARIGLVITIVSLIFWILEPIRVRQASPQPLADAPVTQWLRHELQKIRIQSDLRRGRLWSVLPFWTGAVVFTWGLNTSLSSRIFFSAVLTGINLAIYVTMRKLNQYTWRKADQPLIEELESLLRSNASE